MSKIFHSQHEEHILKAVEQNFAEEMAGFGRALPGAELHEDNELTWFLTGQNGPNGVLLTNFATDDTQVIETRIKETIRYFQQHQLTHFGWTIGPTSYPPDLPNLLEEYYFQHHDTISCMMTETTAPRPPLEMPTSLRITEVGTLAELALKCHVEMTCFENTAEVGRNYQRVYTHSGFGEGKAWHHYIGWLNGEAVAVAAILLHAGIAGIYGISTLPQVRRQGIGTAMVQHLLTEIARMGYAVAVLSPSELSQRIYQRLGFRECCQLYHYTYYFQPDISLHSNGKGAAAPFQQ